VSSAAIVATQRTDDARCRIIIGCGYSGLAANIQISRKLGFKDVMV
jgi:threonine dehydrogenase-like Zn-dependent dehydrogenase